jgi:hypothetical protein
MRKADVDDDTGRHIVGTINTDADIPDHFGSDQAEVEFWESHEISPEFIRTHRVPREQSPLAKLKARRAGRPSWLSCSVVQPAETEHDEPPAAWGSSRG